MGIIPLIAGLVFLAIGLYLIYDTQNFRKIAVHSKGKILGYESHISHSNNRTQTMYTPIIEFQCRGETYTFESSISSGNMSYEIDQEVPVLYMKDNPHEARLLTNVRYWLGGVFSFIGLIAFIIGIINFDFDLFSLVLSLIILLTLTYKGLKIKNRLNKKGIHSFDDIKNQYQTEKKQNKDDNNTVESNSSFNKNYAPSQELITNKISHQQKSPIWLALLFIIVGSGLLIGAAITGKNKIEFMAAAHKAPGMIIGMKTLISKGTRTYKPIIQYIYKNDFQPTTFEHSVSSSHPSWERGDAVTVLYNPYNKHDAMIEDGLWNWKMQIILTFIGSIFFLVGLIILRFRKKKRKTIKKTRNRYMQ